MRQRARRVTTPAPRTHGVRRQSAASAAPRSDRVSTILGLQRTAGNQATSRLIARSAPGTSTVRRPGRQLQRNGTAGGVDIGQLADAELQAFILNSDTTALEELAALREQRRRAPVVAAPGLAPGGPGPSGGVDVGSMSDGVLAAFLASPGLTLHMEAAAAREQRRRAAVPPVPAGPAWVGGSGVLGGGAPADLSAFPLVRLDTALKRMAKGKGALATKPGAAKHISTEFKRRIGAERAAQQEVRTRLVRWAPVISRVRPHLSVHSVFEKYQAQVGACVEQLCCVDQRQLLTSLDTEVRCLFARQMPLSVVVLVDQKPLWLYVAIADLLTAAKTKANVPNRKACVTQLTDLWAEVDRWRGATLKTVASLDLLIINQRFRLLEESAVRLSDVIFPPTKVKELKGKADFLKPIAAAQVPPEAIIGQMSITGAREIRRFDNLVAAARGVFQGSPQESRGGPNTPQTGVYHMHVDSNHNENMLFLGTTVLGMTGHMVSDKPQHQAKGALIEKRTDIITVAVIGGTLFEVV